VAHLESKAKNGGFFFIRLEQLKQVKKGLLRKGTNPLSQNAEKKI
jgi:hypothetical protein